MLYYIIAVGGILVTVASTRGPTARRLLRPRLRCNFKTVYILAKKLVDHGVCELARCTKRRVATLYGFEYCVDECNGSGSKKGP